MKTKRKYIRKAKNPKKRGRAPILIEFPEKKEKLFQAIRLGTNYMTACGFAGINYRNHFKKWVDKAEEEINRKKGPRKDYEYLADFWAELQEAKAEGEVHCLNEIRKAGKEDWKAFAWIAARVYGYTEKTIIEGGDKPIMLEDKTDMIAALLKKFPDKDKNNAT